MSEPTAPDDPDLAPVPTPVPVDGWAEEFPWLVAGTTTRGPRDRPSFDLRLYGTAPAGEVLARWEALRVHTGMEGIVHARQVHGIGLRVHRAPGPGLRLGPPMDAHMTCVAGLLLTVALADCVPVFIVDPARRIVALAHAGWRGAAAGILEHAIGAFQSRFGPAPDGLRLHLGPSIGGPSYEVGPEVFRALGLEDPGRPSLLDLRSALAERAVRAGVHPTHVTRSEIDTFHDPRLFSHRRGDSGRQVAFLGIRDPTPEPAPAVPSSNYSPREP